MSAERKRCSDCSSGSSRGRFRTAVHSYATASFAQFADILDAFANDVHQPLTVDAVALGVAGPVVGSRAMLTNVDLDIACRRCRRAAGRAPRPPAERSRSHGQRHRRARRDELVTLQDGIPLDNGNARRDRRRHRAGSGVSASGGRRAGGRCRPKPATPTSRHARIGSSSSFACCATGTGGPRSNRY